MRLIAGASEDEECGGLGAARGPPQRRGIALDVHLLLAFDQSDERRRAGEPTAGRRRRVGRRVGDRRELGLAAVDEEEVGRRHARGGGRRELPAHTLAQRAAVVRRRDGAGHRPPPVLGRRRDAVAQRGARDDGGRAHPVRDVERLDPPRQRRQAEPALQLAQRAHARLRRPRARERGARGGAVDRRGQRLEEAARRRRADGAQEARRQPRRLGVEQAGRGRGRGGDDAYAVVFDGNVGIARFGRNFGRVVQMSVRNERVGGPLHLGDADRRRRGGAEEAARGAIDFGRDSVPR